MCSHTAQSQGQVGTKQEAHAALSKRPVCEVCPRGAALGYVCFPKAVQEARLSSQLVAWLHPAFSLQRQSSVLHLQHLGRTSTYRSMLFGRV